MGLAQEGLPEEAGNTEGSAWPQFCDPEHIPSFSGCCCPKITPGGTLLGPYEDKVRQGRS